MQNITDNIQVITTDWKQNSPELIQIRTSVFVEEQHVPTELEWDEFDEQSTHFLALLNDKPIATARLKPDGQIGRMAVIKKYRKKGIGTKLLSAATLHARNNGYNMIYLHAQKQAISFYRKFNFICNGIEFLDANILHQAMYKNLV
ncbi:MAG: GNAT family N-acetyltransferase [Gammaproteobacteria bacterium]|nr:GNAT family N-acetyltransferase [Gammaproteobacteria bacterium]